MEPSDLLTLEAGVLRLLRSVRADDLTTLFGSKRVVYLVDYPAAGILAARSITLASPMDTTKKHALLQRLPPKSFILSPGVIPPDARRNGGRWQSGLRLDEAFHLPVVDVAYIRRFFAAFQILLFLIRNRGKYDAILCYNSYAHTLIPAVVAARLLAVPLYIDWEDDYRLAPGNILTRILWPVARKYSSGGIAVNQRMLEPGMQNWLVVEAYCDLGYAADLEFSLRPGMRLLFSGTLDAIRGAHLVPDLVRRLSDAIGTFTLDITGGGVLSDEIRAIADADPRIRFHGFVEKQQLEKLIHDADACLVLQDPGQAFSNGSFPSKIHLYAEHRKPVLMLRANGS